MMLPQKTVLMRGERLLRFRTLANEKTRSFSTRLKRPYLFGWYRPKLDQTASWKRLSSEQRRQAFNVDQLAFFRKHFWFHFKTAGLTGWIPVRHFRKNYCHLNLTWWKSRLTVKPQLACVILMCRYVQPRSDVAKIIRQYRQFRPARVGDFFPLVADQVGRFKNVSRKSMRRIRSQIWRQRPVVMAVQFRHRVRYIVITGFNRRVFSYLMPPDRATKTITRKQLIKAWRKCGYQGFSC